MAHSTLNLLYNIRHIAESHSQVLNTDTKGFPGLFKTDTLSWPELLIQTINF